MHKEVIILRQQILAGNWKMYKTNQETQEFFQAFKPLVADSARGVLVFPPFIALATAVDLCQGTNIRIGAQNIHWEDEGAFTGEISPQMLKALGVTHCLIGHSERRQYFGETDQTVNKKIKAALKHGLIPILCVGETLREREEGISKDICRRQVEEGLKGVEIASGNNLIIAYEPVWAIGTGKTASTQDAQEVIGYIRQVLGTIYGEEIAQTISIQYGGSVKPENIAELMAEPDIDGALVGGASLKAESFGAIVNFGR